MTSAGEAGDLEIRSWLITVMQTHSWDLINRKDREYLKARYGLGFRRGNVLLSDAQVAQAFRRAQWRIVQRMQEALLALAWFDRVNANQWPSIIGSLMLGGCHDDPTFANPSRQPICERSAS